MTNTAEESQKNMDLYVDCTSVLDPQDEEDFKNFLITALSVSSTPTDFKEAIAIAQEAMN